MDKGEYVEIPVLRGFTEIEWLHELIRGLGIICGGYARYCCSQRTDIAIPGDVDIFPKDNWSYLQLRTLLMIHGFKIKHENDVSISYYPYVAKNASLRELRKATLVPIQLIKPVAEGRILTFGLVEEILDNFDFTVTRAAILNKDLVMVDKDFIQDDLDGVLILKHIHCPISSTIRCMKYAKKGFKLPVKEALKLFQDWMDRSLEYKQRIIDFFRSQDFTPVEAQSIYAMMKVD